MLNAWDSVPGFGGSQMAGAECATHFRRRADLSSGRHDIDFDDRYVWN
jgi:hypothetical protein